MDILTHAGIGIIAAAPLLREHPEMALGILAGSVLPDLDSLSRIFGKRAFLRSHQTWSHALLVQLLLSITAGFIATCLDANGPGLAVGLIAGLFGHSLLDWSNTLGVKLLAPFSMRRLCLEYVFFIDAFVLATTGVFAFVSVRELLRGGDLGASYALSYFASLTGYVFAKGILRSRAGLLAKDALTLVPSALVPWHFLGVSRISESVEVFRINTLTGQRKTLNNYAILDSHHFALLRSIPEFRLMCDLSPAYHLIRSEPSGASQRLYCRDLRTRNFGTTFGDLEVFLDDRGELKKTVFHA